MEGEEGGVPDNSWRAIPIHHDFRLASRDCADEPGAASLRAEARGCVRNQKRRPCPFSGKTSLYRWEAKGQISSVCDTNDLVAKLDETNVMKE